MKKIAVVKNTPPNIFAAFGDSITQYSNPPTLLTDKLYSSDLIKQKNYNDVFITTYLSCNKKPCGTKNSPDIENILLYNLQNYSHINDLISHSEKIIIQGLDNINNWPKSNYPHYYFYGTFDKNSYNDYVLYNCNFSNPFSLKIKEFNTLINQVNDKRRVLDSVSSQYPSLNKPVVDQNQIYALKIKSSLDLKNIETLKKLIDIIVIFANSLNIIQHPNKNELVINANGKQYNPTDDLLYYCEIEKNIDIKEEIKFYVTPIKDCCFKNNIVNNFPGFRTNDEFDYFEKITNNTEDSNNSNERNNSISNNYDKNKGEEVILCHKTNLTDCIIEALKSLGGEGSIDEVKNWIDRYCVKKWKDIATTMADMVSSQYGGNETSTCPRQKRVLQRIGRGRYKLIDK